MKNIFTDYLLTFLLLSLSFVSPKKESRENTETKETVIPQDTVFIMIVKDTPEEAQAFREECKRLRRYLRKN